MCVSWSAKIVQATWIPSKRAFLAVTVLRIKTNRNRREKEKPREERRKAHERGMSLHAGS
ncbi:hypothetical protein KRX56_04025 [Dermabacteraceae bacterium TAE3-ERU27]|nr:hypothetical protein [Dermabacteraceae bacterium TAE3-ERU27]